MCEARIDPSIAAKMWRYDPETGVLFWLEKRPGVGSDLVAGTLNNEFRVIVGLLGKRYYAHRIAWVLMTGEEANGMVDHINGNPSDNRWCNLRIADNTRNQGNRLMAPKGVVRRKHGYESAIRMNGKKVSLGTFKTEEEAIAAYQTKHIEYHGSYSCFARPA